VSARDLLVVVPTYNERENLDELVTGIRIHAPAADVLVVDDGSPDGTADAAAAFGDGVDVLRRGQRLGIGSAYRDGFRLGLTRGYRRFITMDADLSHDPRHLPALIAASADADFVVGSRYLHGVSVVNWSLQRLFLSVAANTYARIITALPTRDCTSGFQCIRREVLEAIDPEHLHLTGYAFLVELKYRAFRRGFRFSEVPIIFVDRRYGSSKLGMRHVLRSMWAMWTLRFGRG
jgi:glycosyltransferase involved in cell wall biosynthesis